MFFRFRLNKNDQPNSPVTCLEKSGQSLLPVHTCQALRSRVTAETNKKEGSGSGAEAKSLQTNVKNVIVTNLLGHGLGLAPLF